MDYRINIRKEFQGHTTTPKGVDGAKMAALWRTPTRSLARRSPTIAFSKNSVAAGWVWCTRPKTRDWTAMLLSSSYPRAFHIAMFVLEQK